MRQRTLIAACAVAVTTAALTAVAISPAGALTQQQTATLHPAAAGQAAAGKAAVAATVVTSTATSIKSWSLGTLEPDEKTVQHLGDAKTGIYQVGLSSMRTDEPDMWCRADVLREWYERRKDGEIRFYFEVQNTDPNDVDCKVRVHVALIEPANSGSAGSLSPGTSKSWKWNNANVRDWVFFAGVTPATNKDGTCKFQATWKNRMRTDGENEFVYTVKNIGSRTCDAVKHRGSLRVSLALAATGRMWPPTGGFGNQFVNLTTATSRLQIAGLTPEQTDAGHCEVATGPHGVGGDPNDLDTHPFAHVDFANVGSVECRAGFSFAFVE